MLIKSKELCKELNIHRTTLYRWLKKYTDFPVHRVGDQWRFDLDDIQEWIDRIYEKTTSVSNNSDAND